MVKRTLTLFLAVLLVESVCLLAFAGAADAQTVIATITVGSNPEDICVNPVSNRAYVANYGANTVSVIDCSSNSVIATPAVGGLPYGIDVNPDTNRIYVANREDDTVSIIDGADNSVIATFGVGNDPMGIRVNPETNRVYVANSLDNTVMVFDGTDNSWIATVGVGDHPTAISVNQVTNRIYVANWSGHTVSVINGANNSVSATVDVGNGPDSVAVNTVTNRVYVSNWDSNTVSVIDGSNNSVVATVAVGDHPDGVGVNPGTNRVYVSNTFDWNVSIIEGSSNSVTATVVVGNAPRSICVNPDTHRVYVANSGVSTVSVIDDTPPSITSMSPTSGPTGTRVTINGSDFGTKSGTDKVIFGTKTATTSSWTDTRIIAACPAGVSGTVAVKVCADGKWSNSKSFTVVNDLSKWYLAEGTTAWGFTTYISIANPNNTDLTAHVTYMPTGAENKEENVPLPAQSQTTISSDHISGLIGAVDFSTLVESTDVTRPIAVDRTMTWTAGGAPSPEAHNSVGVTSPAKTWYLPEGSAKWGFETWLLIQNPNAGDATCTITYMVEGGAAVTRTEVVPALSRRTYGMREQAGEVDASIMVEADRPVIPERAMYRNDRREGHDSIGTTASADDFYLAEGCAGYGFTTYILVQNPNPEQVTVGLTYMTGAGPVTAPTFQMEPNSRKTVNVNETAILPDPSFSTRVHGSKPIIAERAMYWGAGSALGEACHDSIGLREPHTTFYLPDGQADDLGFNPPGTETWTLVQNPDTVDVQVEITYLRAGGGAPVTKTETVTAGTRRTFNMFEHSGIWGRASVKVASRTAGKKIMVERSMYWNNRGAGTDTIGGYSD